MSDRTCNDCLYYDVLDGFCTKQDEHCHGYEDACDDFEQETDTRSRRMDDYIQLSTDDLDISEYEFTYTCPHCGEENRETTRSMTFDKEFECDHCGEKVRVWCDYD